MSVVKPYSACNVSVIGPTTSGATSGSRRSHGNEGRVGGRGRVVRRSAVADVVVPTSPSLEELRVR
jgi:hypothetical protein